MALPTAVARKAERAAELMRGNNPPPAPPAPAAGSDDATKLKADLDATKATLADVQQKYRSLQGTHKEQLELQNTIKELRAQVTDLQAKLDEKAIAPAAILTEDERRLVGGDDMVAIMTKVATSAVDGAVKKHLKPLGERFDQFTRMNEAQYWATVDYFVPEFKVQNDDPKFIAWLKEVDPETGALRDDLLQRAHAAQMGYRVAEIFRAYKEGREIGARSTETPPTPPSGPGDINPGPGGGSPTPPPDNSGKKQWSRAEIAAFYDRKRRGLYRGKEGEAEARKIEVEIFAARAEGRVL